MATRKNRRRRLKIDRIITAVFMATCFLYLATSIFLRSYNSSLNRERHELQVAIANLEIANETAQMNVNQLSTYDRISDIAAKDGMEAKDDNAIVVVNND